MPARSVVLEKLVKWNGETHADVTAGEYTQLTGRAGRRGIDVEGHAVVLWQPGMDPRAVAGLASTRTYPLRSSFRPSYNMAVNLVGALGREQARTLLESSFAQFQADASVVGLARQVTRNLEALDGYREAMTCHLGDAQEYGRLRAELKRREGDLARSGAASRKAEAAASLEQLKTRRRRARAERTPVRAWPSCSTRASARRARRTRSCSPRTGGPGACRWPTSRRPSSRWRGCACRRASTTGCPATGATSPPRCASSTCPARSAAAGAPRPPTTTSSLRCAPPCAATRCTAATTARRTCAGRERWHRLRGETDALERRVAGKTSSIARTFDRVCVVLDALGYLDGDAVPTAGESLARVYSESDLLAVESLRAGLWDALSPAELAAVVSSLVYTSRRADESNPVVPSGPVQTALTEMDRLWTRLAELERDSGVQFLKRPDHGFAWATWRWASGARLEQVLDDDPDMTAGDFVRWCKQLVDLLGQVALVAEDLSPAGAELRRTTRKAVDAVRRGVVAYQSVG